jgi:transcription elongation factor Elf1
MVAPQGTNFNCPRCGARYTVIRVEMPPAAEAAQIECVNCGAPFETRAGAFAFKYFLVGPKLQRTPSKRY